MEPRVRYMRHAMEWVFITLTVFWTDVDKPGDLVRRKEGPETQVLHVPLRLSRVPPSSTGIATLTQRCLRRGTRLNMEPLSTVSGCGQSTLKPVPL